MSKGIKASAGTSGNLILLVMGGVIVIFALAIILPMNNAMTKQEERIEHLQRELKDQSMLQPLYLSLIKAARFEKPALPKPEEKKLSRDELGGLTAVFSDAARDSGLMYIQAQPDVNSLKDGRGLLMVDISLFGDFRHLYNYLLTIGKLPYLAHMEQVKVRRTRKGDQIGLRIWLSLE